MADTTDNTATFAADGTLAGIGADNADFRVLYEAQKEESERLRKVIEIGRMTPISDSPDKNRRPAQTAEGLRAQLGELRYQQSSRAERLAGLGLVPSEVSDKGLTALFGRGNDGRLAADLHKSNPFRLKQLREAAKALNIYGA